MRFSRLGILFLVFLIHGLVWSSNVPDLIKEVRAGNLEQVKEILAAEKDANATDAEGNSSLHVAASLGFTDIARVLIDAGADVNAQNTQGRTPIHLASGAGHLNIVLLLGASGADVNLVDNAGSRPMLLALEGRHLKIAEVLSALDEGVDPQNIDVGSDDLAEAEWYELVSQMMASGDGELTDEQMAEFRKRYGYGDDVSDADVHEMVSAAKAFAGMMGGEIEVRESSLFAEGIGSQSYPSVDREAEEAILLRWDFSKPQRFVYSFEEKAEGGILGAMLDGAAGTLAVKAKGDGTADFLMSYRFDDGEEDEESQPSSGESPVLVLQGLGENSRVPGLQAGQQLYLDLLIPLPEQPIAVGETAVIHTKMPLNVYGSMLWVKGTVKLTLEGFVSIDGHVCAKMYMETDVSDIDIPEELGVEYSAFIKGSGVLYFDTEDNCFHSAEIATITVMKADIVMQTDSLKRYWRDPQKEFEANSQQAGL